MPTLPSFNELFPQATVGARELTSGRALGGSAAGRSLLREWWKPVLAISAMSLTWLALMAALGVLDQRGAPAEAFLAVIVLWVAAFIAFLTVMSVRTARAARRQRAALGGPEQFRAWGDDVGFEPLEGRVALQPTLALFRRVQTPEVYAALQGRLARWPTTLAVVTTRNDESVDAWVVLHLQLSEAVGARFAGVSLSHGFGRPAGMTPGWLDCRLESSRFDERFILRRLPEQDEVQLMELFAPDMIDLLLGGHAVEWQQRGRDLCVCRQPDSWATEGGSGPPGVRVGMSTESLDLLCRDAALVADRYERAAA